MAHENMGKLKDSKKVCAKINSTTFSKIEGLANQQLWPGTFNEAKSLAV